MRRWLPPVARLGFAARGAVYLVVGFRAVRAATGWGHRPTDPQGALRTVARQDFGDVMLAALAVGLLAYATWRFAQAVWDLDRKGQTLKGLATRAFYLVSGALHVGLASTAAGILLGRSVRGRSLRDWVASVLSEPLGEWVVALAGAITLGVAAWQLSKAYRGKASSHLDLSRAGALTTRWVPRFERFGVAARGVTFGIMGWFLLMAAWWHSAREAKGLADALRNLRGQPYGPWMLGAVGLGLAAYGIHETLCARYRRIVA
jgi:uncharacterized membrane protein YidH (DUF202 family)